MQGVIVVCAQQLWRAWAALDGFVGRYGGVWRSFEGGVVVVAWDAAGGVGVGVVPPAVGGVLPC